MSLADPSADQVNLPVTKKGQVRITPRLRETYLTPDVEDCVVQASGYHVWIWIWSENENIRIALPLDGPRFERVYSRSIHRWGVNVNRWRTPGKTPDEDERLGWWNQGTLDIGYGGASAKEMIAASIVPFEGVKPDYD